MHKVVLYGNLRKLYGKEYALNISTPKEAINALVSMIPTFKQDFLSYDYEIKCSSDGVEQYLDKTYLDKQLPENSTIHIYPTVKGSKSDTQQAVGKIIVAAALFFVAGPAASAMGATAAQAAAVANAASKLAFMIMINGVGLLLTPKQKTTDDDSSKLIGNTSTVNNIPVPIIYGEVYADILPVSSFITNSNAKVDNSGK